MTHGLESYDRRHQIGVQMLETTAMFNGQEIVELTLADIVQGDRFTMYPYAVLIAESAPRIKHEPDHVQAFITVYTVADDSRPDYTKLTITCNADRKVKVIR
jgi:hypothetical protein